MPATPVVPETITVHLGPPGSSARNVEVPFAAYIKNVASHEIYPTWPENAIRANILAQISYALNRVYTEYYRTRGYDYDITSTTQYDQAYVDGGDVFENISQIVDDSFNNYIVRQGSVEPLFAQFCDGVRTQCGGLSQWGSVDLARDGMNPYEILQYYYGGDISIVFNAPIGGNVPSYPGRPLRRGDVGNDVLLLQRQLSRIRRNYPAIPEIPEPSTVFDVPMEEAVKSFQQIFNLTPDGIVGKATWYKIKQIYNGVKGLSELSGEGLTISEVQRQYTEALRLGDSGLAVRTVRFFLAFLGYFLPELPPIRLNVPEILDWLDQQDIPYGVATATYGELAEAALRRLHIWERLRFLLTEQDAGTPKTQPKIFQLAAQKLHLGRRQIAVVEDSLHALEGAKNGGFFTIGIADPENAPVWKEICATATVHIHDILDMKQFF